MHLACGVLVIIRLVLHPGIELAAPQEERHIDLLKLRSLVSLQWDITGMMEPAHLKAVRLRQPRLKVGGYERAKRARLSECQAFEVTENGVLGGA